ncbi:MAG TPA: trehalose-phosphatase [Kofleriaceae bacterium]
MATEWQHLAAASHLVIALDLDGTLIPFAPTPQEAVVDDELAALLDELSNLPNATVGVISGRPRGLVVDLAGRFSNLAFAAEHGVWRFADGRWDAALPPLPQLDEIQTQLTALAARYPGALIERKSCSVCMHWRRVANEDQAAVSAAAETLVDEWLETQKNLERLPEVEALEVRHTAAHKGNALAWLRRRAPSGASVLAIGDDITDEDMFVSLREGDVGILVAEHQRRTQAHLRLPNPPAVRRFLRTLLQARTAHAATIPSDLVIARAPRHAAPPRLIVASNRLPAAPTGDRKQEVGGLVSALLPVLRETNGIWLGWSGAERDPGLRLRVEDGDEYSRADFDYPPTWRERFYAGFCNQSLWPLFHEFIDRVRYVDDEWVAYTDANVAYARLLVEAGGTGAEVWVQDFHLMLAARELRRAGHQGRLGFYLHIPFPPLDLFQTMPWATEVMSALLEFDRIGFQGQRWADNFIASARGLLGPEGEARAKDRSRVIPVGIDAERFAEAAERPASAELGDFSRLLGDRALLLGVDRLDYSKGVPERLEAFARFLELYPHWRNKVSLVQVSVPTRSEVPEYANLKSRVETLVGRINGAYGEADWVPVRYLYRSYTQDTLAHLYRRAEVALVTPLRDGMNLVAKEYIAAQDPVHPGVLMLSRFCGAAERMHDAVLTNPYHPDGVAADLDRALTMSPEERAHAFASLRTVVSEDTAAAWAKNFLSALRE